MENTNYQNINGWGIDADPENEPTYPMKKYTGDDHNRLNYERPPLQEVKEGEDLHSNERPSMSAVFGTATPLSGFSGKMRRHAFKYSEDNYAHWMTLVLADRVNVIEGLIEDIRNGYIPNIFAEKGWKAEWKYNKKEMVTKVVVAAALFAGACYYFSRKKRLD